MSHPTFNYKIPPTSEEKWGFLRESSDSKDIHEKDEATGLHRTGLDQYLKVIFPNKEFIHDKTIPALHSRFRPDYRCEEIKLIVEFDGLQHYTSPKNIKADEIKTKFYEENGYKVVRIPYFIQLSNKAVKTLFDVDVTEKLFNDKFPSLKDGSTPACLCYAGIERMAREFSKFPEQYKTNVDFLESWENKDDIINGVEILKKVYCDVNQTNLKGNPKDFILESIGFLKAAKIVDAEALKDDVDCFNTKFTAARNSNLALACELFLKAIHIITKDVFHKTHNLKELFSSLNCRNQNAIKELYNSKITKNMLTIKELLKKHSNSFEDWRYIYEISNNQKEFYISEMLAFAESLKFYSVQIYIEFIRKNLILYQEFIALEILKSIMPSKFNNLKHNGPSKSPDFLCLEENVGLEVTNGLASNDKYINFLKKFNLNIEPQKSALMRFCWYVFGHKIPIEFKDIIFENLPKNIQKSIHKSHGTYSIILNISLNSVISAILIKYNKLNNENSSYSTEIRNVDLYINSICDFLLSDIKELKYRLEKCIESLHYSKMFKTIWIGCTDTVFEFSLFCSEIIIHKLEDAMIIKVKHEAERISKYKLSGE